MRIVVLTNGNANAAMILGPLLHERRGEIAGIALIEGDYHGRSGFEALRGLAKVTAFPYLVAKILQLATAKGLQALGARRLPSVRGLAKAHGIPVVSATRVGDERVADALRLWQGDLMVSVSCPQRIPAALVSKFPKGGINIHSSLLPKYAGLAPYYWVLAEGESVTGTSVHYLTPKFDDGNILATRTVEVRAKDSAFGLFHRLCREGASTLCEAVSLAEAGHVGFPQDKRARSYRSHPDMASYRSLRKNGHAIVRLADLFRSTDP